MKAGMRHFVELTKIVEESRAHGRCMSLEQRIKYSYVMRRSNGWGDEEEEEEDDDDNDEDSDSEYSMQWYPDLNTYL
jgi:hypothetical protein